MVGFCGWGEGQSAETGAVRMVTVVRGIKYLRLSGNCMRHNCSSCDHRWCLSEALLGSRIPRRYVFATHSQLCRRGIFLKLLGSKVERDPHVGDQGTNVTVHSFCTFRHSSIEKAFCRKLESRYYCICFTFSTALDIAFSY